MKLAVLNNIELPASDMAAAMEFFTAVFGWEWTEYGPTYSDADAGGVTVGLSTEASVAPMPPAGEESSVGPLVLLQADDADADLTASMRTVIDAGGRIVTQPFAFPGGSRFHFSDPSGNVLGIFRLDTA